MSTGVSTTYPSTVTNEPRPRPRPSTADQARAPISARRASRKATTASLSMSRNLRQERVLVQEGQVEAKRAGVQRACPGLHSPEQFGRLVDQLRQLVRKGRDSEHDQDGSQGKHRDQYEQNRDRAVHAGARGQAIHDRVEDVREDEGQDEGREQRARGIE